MNSNSFIRVQKKYFFEFKFKFKFGKMIEFLRVRSPVRHQGVSGGQRGRHSEPHAVKGILRTH